MAKEQSRNGKWNKQTPQRECRGSINARKSHPKNADLKPFIPGVSELNSAASYFILIKNILGWRELGQ